MPVITQAELERRKMMAELKSRITDAIANYAEETVFDLYYSEIISVLQEVQERFINDLVKDDWKCGVC